MCDHMLKVCEHVLQTACEKFAMFTTKVQLATKLNTLDFEIKRPKSPRDQMW